MALNKGITSPDDYSLPGWETGPEGVVVYVRIRNTQLNIHINTEDFHRSPKALAKLLSNKTKFTSDSREDTADSFDYCDEIATLFLPTLRTLAPHYDNVVKLTLADLSLHIAYRARVEFYDEDVYSNGQFDTVPTTWPFPRFHSSDVEVLYEDSELVFDTPVTKVLVRDEQLFWKPSWISDESMAGVEKYVKIHRSGLSLHELLTSRPYGIVVDSKGALHGQLYYWIDIGHHLTWDLLETTNDETRSKWIAQIRTTVCSLHAIDVVWGDVKAENVVIDIGGNAIVIDLEGGATKGWVDRDKMGTKQGDLQGLERLEDYIMNADCPLRVRDKQLDLDWSDDGASDIMTSKDAMSELDLQG